MLDPVHERLDQQQAAAGDLAQVRRVGRVGQQVRVEARPLVADHERQLVAGEPRRDEHPAVAVRLDRPPLHAEPVILLLVLLAQLRTQLQVAVQDGVGQRLVQGHAQEHQPAGVAQLQPVDVLLQVADQRRDQAGVVLDDEPGLEHVHPLQQPRLLDLGLRRGEDLLQGVGQVAGEDLLGHVTGGALLKGLDGDVLAAVRRHQDDRHQGVLGADGLDELQAVHLGHEHVGEHDVGALRLEHRQRLGAVAGEQRVPATHLLDDGAGEVAVHGRVVHHQHGVGRRGGGCLGLGRGQGAHRRLRANRTRAALGRGGEEIIAHGGQSSRGCRRNATGRGVPAPWRNGTPGGQLSWNTSPPV
ncbi:MAG: hypothetical protein U0797_30735 [Gemmataceae bacterium]